MSSHSPPYRPAATGQQPLPIGRRISRLCERVCIALLDGYRLFISPLLGPRCRFHPSCSVYAQQSIARFGITRGGWLALRRLSRCGPWHPGGLDEVPARCPLSGDARSDRALTVTAAAKAQCCTHGKDL